MQTIWLAAFHAEQKRLLPSMPRFQIGIFIKTGKAAHYLIDVHKLWWLRELMSMHMVLSHFLDGPQILTWNILCTEA